MTGRGDSNPTKAPPRRSHSRWITAVVTITLGGGMLAATIPDGAPAQAAPIETCVGESCTATFSYTGAVELWTLPSDALPTVSVLLVGGTGGSFVGMGGAGGTLATTLTAPPGTQFAVAVGGNGTPSYAPAAGGWGGGGTGTSGYGGSGGGGTFLFAKDAASLWPLQAAAGGGGGGGSPVPAVGGAGGFGTDTSPDGQNGRLYNGTPGAGGATTTSPGTGTFPGSTIAASFDGTIFTPGQGGNVSATTYAGAGGGGYYGGGAGLASNPDSGGGGGSGYVATGLTTEAPTGTPSTGNGSLTISYTKAPAPTPDLDPKAEELAVGGAEANTLFALSLMLVLGGAGLLTVRARSRQR